MHFTSLTVFATLTLLTSTFASPINANLDARHVENVNRDAAPLYNIDTVVKRDAKDSGLPTWKRDVTPPNRPWKRGGPPNHEWKREDAYEWQRDASAEATPGDRDWKRDAAPGDRDWRKRDASAEAAPGDRDWRRDASAEVAPGDRDWKRDASPGDKDWRRGDPNHDWRREATPGDKDWRRGDPNHDWKRAEASAPIYPWKRDADAGPAADSGNPTWRKA